MLITKPNVAAVDVKKIFHEQQDNNAAQHATISYAPDQNPEMDREDWNAIDHVIQKM